LSLRKVKLNPELWTSRIKNELSVFRQITPALYLFLDRIKYFLKLLFYLGKIKERDGNNEFGGYSPAGKGQEESREEGGQEANTIRANPNRF
jgi:hypothetical protein